MTRYVGASEGLVCVAFFIYLFFLVLVGMLLFYTFTCLLHFQLLFPGAP